MISKSKIVFPAVFVLLAGFLFSCESNFKGVQKINVSAFTPVGEADTINLKYTDSGKVKAILVSPKMLDFSNASFPYTEFPKGVDVTLYDNNGKKAMFLQIMP